MILFALQGDAITSRPVDVARIALPLLAYFAIMRAGSFAVGRLIGLGYARTTVLASTAAGNNFELAIAAGIATFGRHVRTSPRCRRPSDRGAGPGRAALCLPRRPPPLEGEHVTPEVLFVRVHNAGRSQMAAVLRDHHARGRVTVRSAGSAPADTINPAVRRGIAEIGIDLSRQLRGEEGMQLVGARSPG